MIVFVIVLVAEQDAESELLHCVGVMVSVIVLVAGH